jgi:hypothetical protein
MLLSREKMAVFGGMFRSKGTFWLCSSCNMQGLLGQSEDQLLMRSYRPFLSALSEYGYSFSNTAEELSIKQKHWQEPYGDRRQELLFIGLENMNILQIRKELDKCLLTDKEFAQGPEAWRDVEDPIGVLCDDDIDIFLGNEEEDGGDNDDNNDNGCRVGDDEEQGDAVEDKKLIELMQLAQKEGFQFDDNEENEDEDDDDDDDDQDDQEDEEDDEDEEDEEDEQDEEDDMDDISEASRKRLKEIFNFFSQDTEGKLTLTGLNKFQKMTEDDSQIIPEKMWQVMSKNFGASASGWKFKTFYEVYESQGGKLNAKILKDWKIVFKK